jgi:hypothetical protein
MYTVVVNLERGLHNHETGHSVTFNVIINAFIDELQKNIVCTGQSDLHVHV